MFFPCDPSLHLQSVFHAQQYGDRKSWKHRRKPCLILIDTKVYPRLLSLAFLFGETKQCKEGEGGNQKPTTHAKKREKMFWSSPTSGNQNFFWHSAVPEVALIPWCWLGQHSVFVFLVCLVVCWFPSSPFSPTVVSQFFWMLCPLLPRVGRALCCQPWSVCNFAKS